MIAARMASDACRSFHPEFFLPLLEAMARDCIEKPNIGGFGGAWPSFSNGARTPWQS
jgi:hypothetical protein